MNVKSDTYKVALHYVASYCSKAERCRWDVLQRLKKFDLSDFDRQEIVSWLEKENFLDEERYCNAFVNDKVRFSRWGRLKIRLALQQKRVDDALIEKALENINQSLYLENLSQLIAKKRRELGQEEHLVLHSKLVRYASGRGFLYSEIERVLQDEGLFPGFI